MLDVPGLDHFAQFCRFLTLASGRSLRLEPFQRVLLADYFAGVSESLVLIPKKNGKTTLMAAVALHHLCFVEDAEVYVAASSRDQAGLLYNAAKRFVTKAPPLQDRLLVRAGSREIRSTRDDGFMRVLASDADTADGVGPTLAIVDELHRHKSTELYDVFSDGLDARDGRMLTISTAGSDEESPLGRMRRTALDEGRVTSKGRYTKAQVPDGSFVMHEWALHPRDDVDDIDLVKQVNPLRAMSKAKLRRRKRTPSMSGHRWRRLACNMWTQHEDAAISALDWHPCHDDYLPLPDGARDVVIGIDLGWKRDTTALVPVGVRDAEDRLVEGAFYPPEETEDADVDDDEAGVVEFAVATVAPPTIIYPPGDGRMTPDSVVKDALRALAARWPTASYAIDPNADGQTIAQWIELELCAGDETRVLIQSQQPAPMCHASMGLGAQIRGLALRQPDDRLLNSHVLAAAAKYHGERWRLMQPLARQRDAARKPIDGAVALAMALRGLRAPAPVELQPFVIRA